MRLLDDLKFNRRCGGCDRKSKSRDLSTSRDWHHLTICIAVEGKIIQAGEGEGYSIYSPEK